MNNDLFERMTDIKKSDVNELNIYKDNIYLKSMYSNLAKNIVAQVEEECNKLEYEGSTMFAQYPDKATILKLAKDIYDRNGYGKGSSDCNECDRDECRDRNCNKNKPVPPPYVPDCPGGRNNPVLSLIEVLICNEMHCRRNRYNIRNERFK